MLQVTHLVARIPLTYLFTPVLPKWLLPDQDIDVLKEIREIRKMTSKKDPEIRRQELSKSLSQPLIDLISQQTEALVSSSFGCQFINEVLFGGTGEKQTALQSIASLAKDKREIMNTSSAGRMLKSSFKEDHTIRRAERSELSSLLWSLRPYSSPNVVMR